MKHFLSFLRVISSPNWVLIRDLEKWYNQKQEKSEEQLETEDFSPPKKRIYRKADSSDVIASAAVFVVALLLIIWLCMSF